MILPGDFQTCMDLENMFFHVSVHKDHQKFLGFSIPDPSTGEVLYYQFSIMVYGLKPAVFIVTTLTQPLVAHLHSKGVRFSMMIDDGRVLGKSSAICWNHHKITLDVFQKAGWNIQTKKTSTSPSMQLYHQGFITDTQNMTYSIPSFKTESLKKEIWEVCNHVGKPIPIRSLSRAVGRICSCLRALGPISRIMLRTSHYLISEATEGFDPSSWDKDVILTPQVAEDLKFIATNIDQENGQPIINHSTGIPLNSFLSQNLAEDRQLRPIIPTEAFGGIVASDASDFMKFSYEVSGTKLNYRELLSKWEADQSSSFRELSVILGTLESNASYFKRDTKSIFYWLTDSTCAAIWLTKGSRVKVAQQLLITIYRQLYKLGARIVPIWVPRTTEELVIADIGSKYKDTDDWGINEEAFQTLETIGGASFTLDCFAYSTNARCSKYYSLVLSPHCSGINAFQQSWGEDYCYVCPPVKLVIDVYSHFVQNPSQGVLVIPYWPTNSFWPVITKDGTHLQDMFFKHHIFKPRMVTGELCDPSYFSNRARATMIALFFNSTIPSTDLLLRNFCLVNGCPTCL